MSTNNTNYTIIQITDTHLFSDQSRELLGYRTHALLAATIDHILNSTVKPNAAFITGDISQDESSLSYQLALEQFERLPCPVYWIHGNHDNESEMTPIFEGSKKLVRLDHLSTPHWDFISINTCRRGTDSGYIEDDEYARFLAKTEAAKKSKKNIAVVMHHHPVVVNTRFLDECMLQNTERFLKIAKEHAQLVICGHVHGDYKMLHDALPIECCPATCFQWKKGTSDVETENYRGYKVFSFNNSSYSSSTVFV